MLLDSNSNNSRYTLTQWSYTYIFISKAELHLIIFIEGDLSYYRILVKRSSWSEPIFLVQHLFLWINIKLKLVFSINENITTPPVRKKSKAQPNKVYSLPNFYALYQIGGTKNVYSTFESKINVETL